MSHQAICWALAQPVKPTSAKHILTVLAHYVSATRAGSWVAFPSVSQLVHDTGQDRKTIITNLKRLVEQGYLKDTGERGGVTKSVPVYQLLGPSSSTNNGTPSEPQSSTEIATSSSPQAVPITGHLSSTDSPHSSTNNGTPSNEGSSTNLPLKQYQSTPEAVPIHPTEQVEQVEQVSRARGTRIPKDWTLTKKLGEWALEKNPAWTRDDVREQAEAFRDYWTAATGQTATKRDWDAAWRTWVRKAITFSGPRTAGTRLTQPHDQFEGAL